MCAEIATYRVQVRDSFKFNDAVAVFDYLAQLGYPSFNGT